MKITVTFESLDEFQAYMKNAAPEAAQKPQEPPKAAPVKNDPPKAQKPKEAPTAAPAPAPKPDVNRVTGEPPAITEDFRVEVRKELAALNKKVGRNIAKELIATFGVDKLTDVRLEDLPALMDKAKEAAS